MIYRVKMDGNDIMDTMRRDHRLVSPECKIRLGEGGSFDFVMPPTHTRYNDVHYLTTTMEVFEKGSCIWFGRPTEIRRDNWNNKKVYCEGALTFFNDSIQRPREYANGVQLHAFFNALISSHNSQVSADRRFTVGNITVANKTVYRKIKDYPNTLKVLKQMCIDAEGGYLFTRRENGVNYIDWYAAMPYSCNQPVQFGLNLLDFSETQDSTGYATCVIPLGKADEQTGEPLTIFSVNNGSDVLESYAVEYYGKITKAVTFDGIDDANDLMDAGSDYLLELQFDDTVIECSAAELSYYDGDYTQFKVGQTVHCISNPHLIDRNLPLTEITLRLDTAEKKVVLGTMKRQSLSEIQRDTQERLDNWTERLDEWSEQLDEIIPDSGGGGSWGGGGSGGGSGGGDFEPPEVVTNPETGNEEIHTEDGNGNTVVTPVPSAIDIIRIPTKSSYTDGEEIKYSGIEVVLKNKDGTLFTDATYTNSQLSMSSLIFPMANAQITAHTYQHELLEYTNRGTVTVTSVGSILAAIDEALAHIPTGCTGDGIAQMKELVAQYDGVNPGLVRVGTGTSAYSSGTGGLQVYIYTSITVGDTVQLAQANTSDRMGNLYEARTKREQANGVMEILSATYEGDNWASDLSIGETTTYNRYQISTLNAVLAMAQTEQVSVPVQWVSTYDGRTFEDTFNITVSNTG